MRQWLFNQYMDTSSQGLQRHRNMKGSGRANDYCFNLIKNRFPTLSSIYPILFSHSGQKCRVRVASDYLSPLGTQKAAQMAFTNATTANNED